MSGLDQLWGDGEMEEIPIESSLEQTLSDNMVLEEREFAFDVDVGARLRKYQESLLSDPFDYVREFVQMSLMTGATKVKTKSTPWKYTIEDNGEGISKEEIEDMLIRLFGGGGGKKEHEGFAMGVMSALSSEAVKVEVESYKDGEAVKFSIEGEFNDADFNPEFKPSKRKKPGTKVTVTRPVKHNPFELWKLKNRESEKVHQYCRSVPIDFTFNGKKIKNTRGLDELIAGVEYTHGDTRVILGLPPYRQVKKGRQPRVNHEVDLLRGGISFDYEGLSYYAGDFPLYLQVDSKEFKLNLSRNAIVVNDETKELVGEMYEMGLDKLTVALAERFPELKGPNRDKARAYLLKQIASAGKRIMADPDARTPIHDALAAAPLFDVAAEEPKSLDDLYDHLSRNDHVKWSHKQSHTFWSKGEGYLLLREGERRVLEEFVQLRKYEAPKEESKGGTWSSPFGGRKREPFAVDAKLQKRIAQMKAQEAEKKEMLAKQKQELEEQRQLRKERRQERYERMNETLGEVLTQIGGGFVFVYDALLTPLGHGLQRAGGWVTQHSGEKGRAFGRAADQKLEELVDYLAPKLVSARDASWEGLKATGRGGKSALFAIGRGIDHGYDAVLDFTKPKVKAGASWTGQRIKNGVQRFDRGYDLFLDFTKPKVKAGLGYAWVGIATAAGVAAIPFVVVGKGLAVGGRYVGDQVGKGVWHIKDARQKHQMEKMLEKREENEKRQQMRMEQERMAEEERQKQLDVFEGTVESMLKSYSTEAFREMHGLVEKVDVGLAHPDRFDDPSGAFVYIKGYGKVRKNIRFSRDHPLSEYLVQEMQEEGAGHILFPVIYHQIVKHERNITETPLDEVTTVLADMQVGQLTDLISEAALDVASLYEADNHKDFRQQYGALDASVRRSVLTHVLDSPHQNNKIINYLHKEDPVLIREVAEEIKNPPIEEPAKKPEDPTRQLA